MIFPEPMTKAVVAVLEEDAAGLSRGLLEKGIVHFSRIDGGLNYNKLKAIIEETPEIAMAETRKRIENILSAGGVSFVEPELILEKMESVDLIKVGKRIDTISAAFQEIRSKQGALESEVRKLLDMQRQMVLFGDIGKASSRQSNRSFLDIQFGTIPEDYLSVLEESLGRLSAVTVRAGTDSDRVALLVISMKRDESAVSEIMIQAGWRAEEIPSDMDQPSAALSTDFSAKISGLRTEQAALAETAAVQIGRVQDELIGMWANLRMNELLAQVRSFFSATERTVLFSGWIPKNRSAEIEDVIKAVSHDRCFIEWGETGEGAQDGTDSPPVKLTNPRFLAPFQMLVENFSTPRYGTIDPTPIVAITYLCMFGLMFADVGQGIVLLGVGICGQLFYRKKHRNRMNLLDLITWCGGAAIISGVLFGSYFGYTLFRPVWFDYHGIVAGHAHGGVIDSVYGILGITVWFGVAVISLGLVLNWINLIAKRKWIPLVFDKGGLVGSLIFAAGVIFGTQYVRSGYRTLPSGSVIALFIGIPVILLALKAPLSARGHHDMTLPSLIMDYFMEWIVEVLETFSGYLANVLSFMRVAGLGIAHASLMIAFDAIARSASSNGKYGIASIAILVIGNALVIGLEGLSAGIQSLRLNYYEFFSKYFDGSGKIYAPVTLKNKSD